MRIFATSELTTADGLCSRILYCSGTTVCRKFQVSKVMTSLWHDLSKNGLLIVVDEWAKPGVSTLPREPLGHREEDLVTGTC